MKKTVFPGRLPQKYIKFKYREQKIESLYSKESNSIISLLNTHLK